MIYRILSYLFILIAYGAFTLDTLNQIGVYEYEYVVLSIIPFMIVLLYSNTLRYITGQFSIVFNVMKGILRFVTYSFNIMVFALYNFSLLYFLNIQHNLNIFNEDANFIITRFFYVLLYSFLIDLVMMGMTAFKKRVRLKNK